QKSECLLSLEAYSQEQKKRICWCLAENITKQQHPAAAPAENKTHTPTVPLAGPPGHWGMFPTLLGLSFPPFCPVFPWQMLETDTEELRVMPSEEEKVAGGDACLAAVGAAEGALKEAVPAALGAPLEEKKVVIVAECVEEQPGSRPAFVIPELRLDSTADSPTDEEEDEEEDSDQHCLERSEVKRCSMIEPSVCEPTYTLTVQGSLRRRTHSEGSLLQETKGHCFTSDTTLNCLDIQGPQTHWALPSPRTLKKELTKNGGSIHQLGLLFSGHRKV
ncbi:Regulator of G-protein signaling 3, partial [Chelonia mydas]